METEVRPFPSVVRIEAAGRCNFKCRHCPVGLHGNNRPVMNLGTFQKIFDSLPRRPQTLVFYHGGEPLLCKDLEGMIVYAKINGVGKTVFNTNASLLTMERAKALYAAGLDEMRVSFDGESPEDNDRIRRGSNFYRHAPIVKQAAKLGLNVTIYNVKFDGDPQPAQYLTEFFGDTVKYRTDLARTWAHEEKDATPRTGAIYCTELFEKFSILSDGNVVTCCEDLMGDYTYGNVLEESPLAIWRRMEGLRNQFMQKEYPELCKRCYIVTGNGYKK